MKIYLCMSSPRKRDCRSVTIEDSTENCRELLAFLHYFSYNLRTYELKRGVLKVFVIVPDTQMIYRVFEEREDGHAKVSDNILV